MGHNRSAAIVGRVFGLTLLLVLFGLQSFSYVAAEELISTPDLIFPFPEGQTWRITCGYADSEGCGHPDNQSNRFALDLQHADGPTATEGQPVSAASSGTVVRAEWGGDDSFGWYVKIDHGDGFATIYAHLQAAPGVTPGQEVVQGEVLGNAGCTGLCTGPHVHFVLLLGSESVPPEPMCEETGFADGQLHTGCVSQVVRFVAAGPGDATCDGTTDSIDAVVVLQLGAGLILSLECQHAADVNWDDASNVLDAVLILQFAAGLVDSLAPGIWSEGASMPTPRTEITSAKVGDVIYVIGGFDAPGTNTSIVEAYATASDSWSTKAPLPISIDHSAAIAVDGKIYVLGGYADFGKGMISEAAYEYDPTLDEWTALDDMPLPRAAAAAVATDGVIYLLGGVGPEPDVPVTYNPSTGEWGTIDSIAVARDHVTASAIDGLFYLIGGRENSTDNVDTVEVFEPVAGVWKPLLAMPTPRGGLASGVLDGRIHVIGGEYLSSDGSTIAQHEVYSPERGSWRLAPTLPKPRHGLTTQVVNGRLYVIGGAPTPGFSVSDVVEIFELKPTFAPQTESIPLIHLR